MPVDDLFLPVYEELRSLAAGYFRRGPAAQTLQPTVLVHEAYLRLARETASRWKSRGHFLAVAAKAMRQVLIDHHRRRSAAKRGGRLERISIASAEPAAAGAPAIDFLALNEALERLEALDGRQARVVELRFFGDLSMQETAEVLEVSLGTVEKDWRAARAWLARELRKGDLP
jgi:RNA polymerase sigma factor (TIGR02999 family)